MLDAGPCPNCWHQLSIACICPAVGPLKFTHKVRFIVYLHSMEVFNAGDDGELLKLAPPGQCELLVCGRRADDERLVAELADGNGILLLPSDDAIEVGDLAAHGKHVGLRDDQASLLKIIVLDGTWNRVKSLKRYIQRLGCEVLPVRLRPQSLEYWVHRRSRRIYSRTQSQPDRICTVEAVALILRELGEFDTVCDELIRYVEVNNMWLQGM